MPTVNLYFVTILLAFMMYLKSSFSQCSVSDVFFAYIPYILSDAFAITIIGISSGRSRPSVRGGQVIQSLRWGATRSKKKKLDLRASVWSKNKGGGAGPFLDPPLIRNSIAGGSLHLSLCYFVSSYKRTIFYSAERSESEQKVICVRFSLPSSPSIHQKRLLPKVVFLSFAFNLSLRNDGWFT